MLLSYRISNFLSRIRTPLFRRQQAKEESGDWFIEGISNALRDAGTDWSKYSDDDYRRLIEKLVEESFFKISDVILEQLHADAKSMHKDRKKFDKYVFKQIKKTWGHPVDLLEMLIVIAEEVGDKFNSSYRSQAAEENNIVFEALTRIHARGCQIAFEVLALLKHGFSDGAHARWRALHELAVVAYLISSHDYDLAERYLLHEAVESYKAMNEYQRYYERLGYEGLDAKIMDELREVREELRDRYGDNYLNPNGWAAEQLKNANPSISEMERAADLEHWRPLYRLASDNIHATASGLYFRLGIPKNLPLISDDDVSEVLPSGPSMFGLTNPGHSTAITLGQITSTFLSVTNDPDLLLGVHILNRLEQLIGDTFLQVDPDLFDSQQSSDIPTT